MHSNLDSTKDDLPLMANTSHMLVRHYVLDLTVDFDRKVIGGSAVLFFEAGKEYCQLNYTSKESWCSQMDARCKTGASESVNTEAKSVGAHSSTSCNNDLVASVSCEKDKNGNHGNRGQTFGISSSQEDCCDTKDDGSEDFVLVLDCCDLSVLKVEEVDVSAVFGIEKLIRPGSGNLPQELTDLRNVTVQKLVALPAGCWQEQHNFYLQCSRAPGCGELPFVTDAWSLQIRKPGVHNPGRFPHALRIRYETKPEGGSVRWTYDQNSRPCVYTAGSPINNRALFPCQEPPVAMSTWQAQIQSPDGTVVLMSGENSAGPTQTEEAVSTWFYYVTMPMPASTFTIAVGHWIEVKGEVDSSFHTNDLSLLFSSTDCKLKPEYCSHMEYPCRFQSPAAQVQAVIPHRVFAPCCLREKCNEVLLPLLPQCLMAAHNVLGTHPFARLDVLIVPAGFSSLGMSSPHIIFLSQSVLSGRSHLCGTRVCHEIAHAWFGLAIGARDWTEEWISEGFATYLEDIFWAHVQKLSLQEAKEQHELKALLRWRLLRDEVENSEEELQVLRPKKEYIGDVSASGASIVKHALNPGKTFMQVHYLKGYFLLWFLANKIGEEKYLKFFRQFVQAFHGQLILSQDFLHMLLESFPELNSQGLSIDVTYQEWLDTAGIPKPLMEKSTSWVENRLVYEVKDEVTKWIRFNQKNKIGANKRKRRHQGEDVFKEVGSIHLKNHRLQLLPDQLVLLLELLLEEKTLRPVTLQRLQRHYCLWKRDAEVRHRWCEMVIKHKYTAAYAEIEKFLQQDQAMGVYLYGELMVNEDARQQRLAQKCFTALQEEMDPASLKVVGEMIL
nr:PREDICTED: aminopeptidase O [Latimeria chalumnae]|eukprot:XP_014343637.1 PREDICTED: aminopeptidase O [Latimeria chalumnae]